MPRYMIECEVMASAITFVEANGPEEALEIAKGRCVVLSDYDGSEEWVITEADGEPTSIGEPVLVDED